MRPGPCRRQACAAAQLNGTPVTFPFPTAAGVALPPKSSGVYGNSKVLSRGDWRKAISW